MLLFNQIANDLKMSAERGIEKWSKALIIAMVEPLSQLFSISLYKTTGSVMLFFESEGSFPGIDLDEFKMSFVGKLMKYSVSLHVCECQYVNVWVIV